ncbi:MAG: DMT family transporter, partial [Rikenellaceae bacterium]
MPKKYSKIEIILIAVLACLVWGSAFAFAKIGFEYMPPVRLSGYRFMLAGLILIPILVIRRYDWSELSGQFGFITLFAVIQTFFQYGLFYFGLNLVPASISAIIIGAGPFFVTIMAHYFLKNDQITIRKSLSIICGLLGVVFISLKNNVDLSQNPNFYWGVLALVMSNVIGSASNIVVVRHTKKLSSISLTAMSCFIGGAMLYLLSLVVEPEGSYGITGYPFEFYGALLWLAMIPALAFSLWYFILQLPGVKVSEINIWKFLTPVFGVVLSWIMLSNEKPNI